MERKEPPQMDGPTLAHNLGLLQDKIVEASNSVVYSVWPFLFLLLGIEVWILIKIW